MEKTLGENIDIYADCTGFGVDDGIDENSRSRISLNRWFYDDRWSKNRCLTSLEWSTQSPESLLASYNNNDESLNVPDGVALIWNSKYSKTSPEYVFHCQSAVMTSKYARFHPNLVLGGTYAGQIVLWDNRVQKRTPVLLTTGHTHPVYCMHMVGTHNEHNLITISTDGRMCAWSLNMLSLPQETMQLKNKHSRHVAVTSLDFANSEVDNFVVGSEEGAAYSVCRNDAKKGITNTYDGHQGPITGINVNSVKGKIDFSHMFLTSSIDWTIKLWSLNDSKPIYSFEDNRDYVLDVAWSPTHPALFAAVNGSGRLDLWNLNDDTESVAGLTIEGNPALNRVSWTPSGLRVSVGDNAGKIWVYDLAESLAHPRHDEWSKLIYTTQELRSKQVEEEMDKINLGISSVPISSKTSLKPLLRFRFN